MVVKISENKIKFNNWPKNIIFCHLDAIIFEENYYKKDLNTFFESSYFTQNILTEFYNNSAQRIKLRSHLKKL